MYALYLHNTVIAINKFVLCNYKHDTSSNKTRASTCDKYNDVVEGLCEVRFCSRIIRRKSFCLVFITKNEREVYFGRDGYLRAEFTMICSDCVPELLRNSLKYDEDLNLIENDVTYIWRYAIRNKSEDFVLPVIPRYVRTKPHSPPTPGQGNNQPDPPTTKLPLLPPTKLPLLLNLRTPTSPPIPITSWSERIKTPTLRQKENMEKENRIKQEKAAARKVARKLRDEELAAIKEGEERKKKEYQSEMIQKYVNVER